MLIIGFAMTETLLATLFFVCETCGQQAAHELSKRSKRFSLFFIPLFSIGTTYVDRCDACARVLEVSRDQAEKAASQTGPDLQ